MVGVNVPAVMAAQVGNIPSFATGLMRPGQVQTGPGFIGMSPVFLTGSEPFRNEIYPPHQIHQWFMVWVMDHGRPFQVHARWVGTNQGLYPRFIESQRGFWNGGAPFRGQYIYLGVMQLSVSCELLQDGSIHWTVR
jgi:hypothetical protein